MNKIFENTNNVSFEDVDHIAKRICCDIISSAIKTSNGTKEGIIAALESAGATVLDAVEYTTGGFDINCDYNYTSTDEFALKVPYTLNMTISIAPDMSTTFMFGLSGFDISKNGRTIYCDTDVMYCVYDNHPESFDVSDYLDLSKLRSRA